MKEFLVKSEAHSHFFKASSAEVAVKRFLNYLRRYTKDRPKIVISTENVENKGFLKNTELSWGVEWYTGPKQDGVLLGGIGE